MKIGFFTDSYFPQVNGVTYTLASWRKLLERRGHEVSIYYPAAEYEPATGEYPLPSIGFRYYPDYKIAYLLGKLPGIADLDIIHQHGMYSMAMIALGKAWWHKKPKVSTFHTPGGPYMGYLPGNRFCGSLYRGAYNTYERLLLNRFDYVTTGSPVIRDMLEKNRINGVEVLSNGIDLKLFEPKDEDRFRRRHEIPNGPLIGFCGRIGFEKHLEDLIRAAKDFRGTVLIAGDGPALGAYKEMAKRSPNVMFVEFIEREGLAEFYSALDVFVFPSHCETQGLVALEAMACATPVVCAPVLALSETVEDGVTGFHYRPDDPDDLLAKVRLCYTSMDELSSNCIKNASRHSIEKSVDRLEMIYEEVIAARQ